MLESGERQLLGHAIAADRLAMLQDEAAVAGPRKVGGGDQAVVPGAGDDNIEAIGHVHPPELRSYPAFTQWDRATYEARQVSANVCTKYPDLPRAGQVESRSARTPRRLGLGVPSPRCLLIRSGG